jgi:hypothetical protein
MARLLTRRTVAVMPKYITRTRTDASADALWPLVADLTRHGEWSADEVSVTATGEGTYESVARAKGREFRATLTVLASEPTRRFAFRATDATGTYEHVFTLAHEGAGTVVTRETTATALTPAQRALYYLALPTVRKPSARTSLAHLAAAASKAGPKG